MAARSDFFFTVMHPSRLQITDFTYELPIEKIALHPLPQRDASRLLTYREGIIQEKKFGDLPALLPPGSLLVFNNTRVINARLLFKKSTGATIEIFCLEPLSLVKDYSTVMGASGRSLWKCLVGGAAKWKEPQLQKELLIGTKKVLLQAKMLAKENDAYHIEFSWTPAQFSFAEIIEVAGSTPLPPYIKRSADDDDRLRYQTVFAKHEGSVAAPTAGLHFTKEILESLEQKRIDQAYVTLHVGAGTFKPVKAAQMQDHEMHAEYIDVSAITIKQIAEATGTTGAVGTTALRTLESLYWLGVKAYLQPAAKELTIQQWDAYQEDYQAANLSAQDALNALLRWMKASNQDNIFTQTQLLIAPGYTFKIAKMLITNFHQPQSTLLLLVAAAIGDDWRKMYDYALQNNFRFLSYGDSNLIFIAEK